ncbi:hypothetical protein [Longimicrobium sp.]|uniref:hypothetical protein n=1 Tax=Longimicrobium sp. TaxID=2029185 RepID=UPI002B850C72|nr:hypothetical protein [Longimicrobium sp.]HSU14076.1 hypothetical protein [Longimicrobium sp.]
MRARTLSLSMLAAASLAACGRADLPLTGADAAPARAVAAAAAPICVNFNVPPVGALFGAPVGTVPGSVVWVENGIPVSVHKFLQSTGAFSFNWMRIEPAPAAFTLAAGNTGHTNNINAGFNFTGLPFIPTKVTFHFLHLGGYENLSVNGSPLVVTLLTPPPTPIGGVNAAAVWAGVPGGVQGTVTLSGGPVKSLIVGGQEFWLDDVCAYP